MRKCPYQVAFCLEKQLAFASKQAHPVQNKRFNFMLDLTTLGLCLFYFCLWCVRGKEKQDIDTYFSIS